MKKIMLITGASKGIGFSIARSALESGYIVILNGRNQHSLEKAKESLNPEFLNDIHLLPYDVSDVNAVKEAFLFIKRNFGKLNVVVNNAGQMEDAVLGTITQNQLKTMFDVNSIATINHIQYASRIMIRQKQGIIINITSIMGRFGNAGQVAYSASKAAVIGATYAAAKELAPYNIRVNAIAPGFVETDLVKDYDEATKNKVLQQIKLGRIGQPEEVAELALFLASFKASYITGQVIGIDGGMVI